MEILKTFSFFPVFQVVKFITPCFHPNIDLSGAICLDILKDKWSALYDVRTILLSIQSLLGEPNNDSPLNAHASLLWNNQTEFKKYLDEFYEKNKEEAWNRLSIDDSNSINNQSIPSISNSHRRRQSNTTTAADEVNVMIIEIR